MELPHYGVSTAVSCKGFILEADSRTVGGYYKIFVVFTLF